MKRKFLWMILVGVVLTGCASEDLNMSGSALIQGEEAEYGDESMKENTIDTSAAENAGGEENNNVANDTEKNGEASDSSETGDMYVLSFEATTMDGEEITSECFAQSKLTMLNVWATYCGPCLNEMPDLGEIAASYDVADFQMLGIISDVVEEDVEGMEYAAELIVQTGADYPHIPLNQSLYSNLVGGVDSVPTTFFVNQKGELLGYVLGAQSKETWEEIINNLLAEME